MWTWRKRSSGCHRSRCTAGRRRQRSTRGSRGCSRPLQPASRKSGRSDQRGSLGSGGSRRCDLSGGRTLAAFWTGGSRWWCHWMCTSFPQGTARSGGSRCCSCCSSPLGRRTSTCWASLAVTQRTQDTAGTRPGCSALERRYTCLPGIRCACQRSTTSPGSKARTPPLLPGPHGGLPCQGRTASAQSCRWRTS